MAQQLKVPAEDGSAMPTNILIRTPNWIGDHVMARRFYESMRRHYPAARITFLTPKTLSGFDDSGLCDEKVIVAELFETARILRDRKFDLGVSLTASFSSSFLLFLACIPQRVGYAEPGAELFLTSFRRWQGRGSGKHKSELYADLFEFLTAKRAVPLKHPSSNMSGEATIVLAPGASIELREWPYVAELTRRIRERFPSYRMIVVGTEDRWKKLEGDGIENRVGATSLPELLEILKRASLVIANDSGIAHLAATVAGVPTLVLFGPGDPAYVKPAGANVHILRDTTLRCSPCEKPYCRAPYGFQACLRNLAAESVLAEIQTIL